MRAGAVLLLLVAAVALLWPKESVRSELLGTRPLAASRVNEGPFPKALFDPVGREFTLAVKPRRIVSMILSGDEILVDLVGQDRLRGLTYFASDPVSSNCASRIPKELAFVDDDLERVIALEPDLMLVAGYTEASFVRPLAAAGIPLLYLSGYFSFDDVRENIRLVAAATGEEVKGRELVSRMNSRIDEVRKRVSGLARPRTLFFIEDGGTHGAHTTVNEIIETAGGDNIAASEAHIEGTRRLSLESAISLDPDVILLTRFSDDPRDPVVNRYLDDPNWQGVRAVRNRRVYSVPYRSFVSVSHYVADGVETVARALHPEAFGS